MTATKKVRPVTKFGFKFTLGKGTYQLGAYSFNSNSNDEAEWVSRAKAFPNVFVKAPVKIVKDLGN